jgi:hypothetical protein
MDFRLPNPSYMLTKSERCIDLFIGGLGKGFLVLLFSSEKWPETKKLMVVKKFLFVCPVPYAYYT